MTKTQRESIDSKWFLIQEAYNQLIQEPETAFGTKSANFEEFEASRKAQEEAVVKLY